MPAPVRHPVPAPVPPPVTTAAGRWAVPDQVRSFVIGLVVLHHGVLAYCTFGHVDRLNYALSTAPIVDAQRWAGFDVVVRLNDGFFMPLLFLLSGLFVRDGLVRKGRAGFLRARLRRLGLPFVVAELTVVPLAYYPSFLQAGGAPGPERFWATTITTGPWPSGPPWFLALLALFDAIAAVTVVPVNAHEGLAARRWLSSPGARFALLLAGTCLLYLPPLLVLGPTRWFGIGPLAVQGSRIGLYAAYFAAGVALGARGSRAAARFGRLIAPRWMLWAALATLTGAAFVVAGGPAARAMLPTWGLRVLSGATQAAFCAAACFALPALFLRFGGRPGPIGRSLIANGFAIYLLHYPFVTWIQYGLLSVPTDARLKALITCVCAFVASWAAAGLLRRVAAIGRRI